MPNDSPSDGPDVFPDSAEAPERPLDAEDLSPFTVDTDEYDEINDLATAEWKATTTADERIRAVISRTVMPKTASEIADIAAVSESKARSALKSLVDEGVAEATQTTSGTAYRRDSDRYLIEQLHQLATSEGLLEQLQAVKAEIGEYQDRYEADAPEDVLLSDCRLGDDELTDISHWRTAERDLDYLRAAYRIQQAKERVHETDDQVGTESGRRPTQ
ncbi:winged helix-turn-helix domain-containing protein [Haloglomus halophilum]|uniref:winged helix-turn-helix domain-containing protein n=1 Tax=Haloglomus halophilum TaxID=2962672 RepID=UPI0020C9DCD5|nr:winged helix-turn-helix domain-containing protein [Haloglomus halophilum]